MSITIDDLITAYTDGTRQIYAPAKYGGGSNTANTNYWSSSWRQAGSYQAAIPPTTAEACNAATVGGLPIVGAGVGYELRLARWTFSPSLPVGITLFDRLVHISGLNGTLTTPQDTSSMTGLLPARAGTGEGVELWLEWYTATGATVTNITASYTNQAGTSGQTTQSITTPATVRASTCLRLPLQVGDTGVRSVESVTLSASTAAAGNFGVTLMKRESTLPNGVANAVAGHGPISLGLPKLEDNGCYFFVNTASTTVLPTYDTELLIIKVAS